MLAIERKNEILAILQKEQRVLVSELSKRYEVTDETIRRDLEKLEKEGFVKRTYGGAVLPGERIWICLFGFVKRRTGERSRLSRDW